MAKFYLQIVEGPQSGTKHALESDLTIGRRAGCDLVLEGDEKVSGRHCQVVLEGGSAILRDLESTNGTRVDGKRIEEIPIAHGDRFQVGKTVLQLVDGERGEVVDAPTSSGIDAEALARSSKRSPIALIALLVLLAGGAAAWWFFLRADAPRNKSSVKKVARIEGNLLSASLAHLESDDAEWLPVSGGGIWARGSQGKSGRASLVAELGGEVEGAAGPLFAVAIQEKAFPIGNKSAFRARCAIRSDAAVRAGLRVCFFGMAPPPDPDALEDDAEEGEETQRRFERKPVIVLGPELKPVSASSWETLELRATVPPGVVEAALCIVAALPASSKEEATVRVDEIALLEDGEAAALPKQIAGASIYSHDDSGGLRITVGPKALLSSAGGLPRSDDAPLLALSKVFPLPACDAGGAIDEVKIEGDWVHYGFRSDARGGFVLRLPREVAESYRVRSGTAKKARFAQHSGPASFDAATGLLWGADAQALLLEIPQATQLAVVEDGDDLRFEFSERPREVSLRVGFEEERLEAMRLARAASAARSEGRPAEALRIYSSILQERPFDESAVREARVARGEMLSVARTELQGLERDFEEAKAFEYDGLFEDLLRRADKLDARQDEFKDAIAGFRAKVQARLREVRQARGRRRAAGLSALAKSLDAAGQSRLAKLVKNFVETKLPAAPKDGEEEGDGEDRD